MSIQGSGEVSEWKSLVALRTACATPEELKIQNAMEDPVGKEISLTNELAATERFLQAIEKIREWKQTQYCEVSEEGDGNLHLTFAKQLKQEEEDTLTLASELIEEYRSKLKKRERRQKQKAKKKAKQAEQKILTEACADLD